MINPTQRVEQVFHDHMWSLANDSMKLERTVSDARNLAYTILKRSDDELLRYEANYWLDTNGRDPRRERELAERDSS